MRYVCGNFCDPVIEEDETVFEEISQDESLALKVEEHLEEEDYELEQIKEADSRRVD